VNDAPRGAPRRIDARYRLDEQVGFLLRKATQRHITIFSRAISDLTPPQFATLAKLHEVGATSQNQLGVLIATDAATIKGVIDRLKKRGLVQLGQDAGDKRRLVVSLTPEGRQAIGDLLHMGHQVSADTLAPLNAREAATLLKLLSKIS